YVYFRYSNDESVMVVLNNNEKESRTIHGENYAESIEGFTEGTDIISGRKIEDLGSFTIAPKTAMIIELK
ncbi:MAG: alpha-amlyase, partial [Bacteroidetes bacterium]